MRAEDLIDEFLEANNINDAPEIEIVEDYTVEASYDVERDIICVPDPVHAFITFLAHEFGHRLILRNSRFYRTWVLGRAIFVWIFWFILLAGFIFGIAGTYLCLEQLKTAALIMFFVWLAYGLIFAAIERSNENRADRIGWQLYKRWQQSLSRLTRKPAKDEQEDA